MGDAYHTLQEEITESGRLLNGLAGALYTQWCVGRGKTSSYVSWLFKRDRVCGHHFAIADNQAAGEKSSAKAGRYN